MAQSAVVSSVEPVQSTTPAVADKVLTPVVKSMIVAHSGREDYTLLPAKLSIASAVTFRFDGTDSVKNVVYVDACRYYFAIDEFADRYGGSVTANGDSYSVSLGSKTYAFSMTRAECTVSDGSRIGLVDIPVEKDGRIYTCLSNLTRVFGLVTNWDFKNQTVDIYKDKDPVVSGAQNTLSGNTALIRLEDIYTDGQNTDDNAAAQLRLRAVADYLYQKGIPFGVAWIPRCIIPDSGIDNDCETTWSICNCGFIYTLDYLQARGGSIGLHGYTHADKNAQTGAGSDFGSAQNTTSDACQAEMNRAKNAAVALKIPYTFFEFPHYAATPTQFKVAEQNFKIIYQKYAGKECQKSLCTINQTLYVGTPIDYLNNRYELDTFISRIKNVLQNNGLGSFFYHPHIENDWIQLQKSPDGYPSYSYAPGSPLEKILGMFSQYGCTFKQVTDLYGI